MHNAEITRDRITATYQLIRPHIRRTPVVEVDAADFGLGPINLIFKLELLQHSGSFKARGAFTNLLTRTIPPAGVVAASGGNHGVAVAFAAMKLGRPARIFVPTVCSAEKLERIRGYGADLVVTGERVGVLVCGGNTTAVDFNHGRAALQSESAEQLSTQAAAKSI